MVSKLCFNGHRKWHLCSLDFLDTFFCHGKKCELFVLPGIELNWKIMRAALFTSRKILKSRYKKEMDSCIISFNGFCCWLLELWRIFVEYWSRKNFCWRKKSREDCRVNFELFVISYWKLRKLGESWKILKLIGKYWNRCELLWF